MHKSLYLALLALTCFSCQSQHNHSCVFENQISIDHDRCGYVDVPNNWEQKSKGNTQIAYLVIKSKSSNRKEDPVIFIQGGPGGSVLPFANIFQNLSFDSDRDFIMYDQRGMGFSNEICPGLSSSFLDIISADMPLDQEDEALLEMSKECIKTLSSPDFNMAFGSTESVKDIEALRQHLGYKQLNLFGGSYGTRLGLMYMELFPNQVRASVLSGLFPSDIRPYEHVYTNINRCLEKLFITCANDSNCSNSYPELKTSFSNICKSLELEPRVLSNTKKNIVINKQDFLLLIQQMFYDRSTIAEIPSFIMAFKHEKNNTIIKSIQDFANRLSVINVAAYWSVMVTDEGSVNNSQVLKNDGLQYPELSSGISLFTSDPEVIKSWPSQNNINKSMKAVVSDIPTLLVSGAWDPVTPPSNAKKTAKSLSHTNLVIFPNDGHCPMNACLFQMAKSFLNQPNQDIDDSCTQNTRAIRFN